MIRPGLRDGDERDGGKRDSLTVRQVSQLITVQVILVGREKISLFIFFLSFFFVI